MNAVLWKILVNVAVPRFYSLVSFLPISITLWRQCGQKMARIFMTTFPKSSKRMFVFKSHFISFLFRIPITKLFRAVLVILWHLWRSCNSFRIAYVCAGNDLQIYTFNFKQFSASIFGMFSILDILSFIAVDHLIISNRIDKNQPAQQRKGYGCQKSAQYLL